MNYPVKILYVDDEPMNLELFRLYFDGLYQVLTAASGSEALEVLDVNKDTTVVISDMKMPGMNGIEFVNKAKKGYPDIRYFILTGYDINTEIQEALDSNLILQYFRKPFNFNEIDATIKTVCID